MHIRKMVNRIGGLAMVAVLVAACGGGSAFNSDAVTNDDTTVTPTDPTVTPASVTLLASNPTMGTAEADKVTLTAVVKNASNRLMGGQTVVISSNSGTINQPELVSDELGRVEAELSPGTDPTNRTIRVTATAGDRSATYDITATGTTIAINGPTNLSFGDDVTYTLTLADSRGNGIGNQALTVTSAGNTVSPLLPGSWQTDANGQLKMALTPASSSTIQASALNATGSFAFTVSNDQLDVNTATSEVEIGTCAPVTATWLTSGEPVADVSTVTFSVTRGTVYTDAACTTESATKPTPATTLGGDAVVYVKSLNPGPVTVTATTSSATATHDFEFVASTPASFNVRVGDSSIDYNESTWVEAVVVDAQGNVVKNTEVLFSIQLDSTGATIDPGQVLTDSYGRARTTFTASSVAGGTEAVTVQVDVPAIADPAEQTKTTQLTVAGAAVSVTLGFGKDIVELDSTRYQLPVSVVVSDSAGHGIANQEVSVELVNTLFYKGVRAWNGSVWAIDPLASFGPCGNEDLMTGNPENDLNDSVDDGEDLDNNGRLSPGRPAVTDPSITTDDTGTASFFVTYPKDAAQWTVIRLTASAGVNASAVRDGVSLPVLAGDVNQQDEMPAGYTSPYGVNDCAIDG